MSDEDHLTVLVRYAGSHPVGRHVQSVHFDLTELREQAGVTTLDVTRDEVLHGAIHVLTCTRSASATTASGTGGRWDPAVCLRISLSRARCRGRCRSGVGG